MEAIDVRPAPPVAVAHEVADDPLYAAVKRSIDIVVSAFVLVVAAPLILLLMVIVRLDSPGPIIFRQKRVARGGGVFRFYKFRTMWVDARERFPDLYAYKWTEEEFANLLFCGPNDPRTTRFGRWLRTTSLDELPNLINVLLGDMSLVGPRPEIPEMLPYYKPEQRLKFAVKPGVTCLWQVNGRDLLRRADGIAMDVDYVHRRSLRTDLAILLKTIKVVVFRIGAY
jgi:lipopolysaccharide/colanic/teichoic acid biosynthesis glycosyltransferase